MKGLSLQKLTLSSSKGARLFPKVLMRASSSSGRTLSFPSSFKTAFSSDLLHKDNSKKTNLLSKKSFGIIKKIPMCCGIKSNIGIVKEKKSKIIEGNNRRFFHESNSLWTTSDNCQKGDIQNLGNFVRLSFTQHVNVLEELKALPEVSSFVKHVEKGDYQNALLELDMVLQICNQMMGSESKYILTLKYLQACLYMELNKFSIASEILQKILFKDNDTESIDPLLIPGIPNEHMVTELLLTLISSKIYNGNLTEAEKIIETALIYCDKHAESYTNLYSRIFVTSGVIRMIQHGRTLGEEDCIDVKDIQEKFNSVEDNNIYPFFQKGVRLAESNEELGIALCNLGYYHYWRSFIWNSADDLNEAENTWIEAIGELDTMLQSLEEQAKLKNLDLSNVYQLRKTKEALGEIYLNLAELAIMPRMLMSFDSIDGQTLDVLDRKVNDATNSKHSFVNTLKDTNKSFLEMLQLREKEPKVQEKINSAQEYASKGLAIQEDLYGHEDAKLARSLMLLGRCYHMSGEAVSAEGLYRSAIDKLINSQGKKYIVKGSFEGSIESALLVANGLQLNASILYDYVRTLSLYRLLLIEWDKREKDAIGVEKEILYIMEQVNAKEPVDDNSINHQLLLPAGLMIFNRPLNTIANRQQISHLLINSS